MMEYYFIGRFVTLRRRTESKSLGRDRSEIARKRLGEKLRRE